MITRFEEKLSDFSKALNRLNEAIEESKNNTKSTTLKDRNLTSRVYDEEVAVEIFQKIVTKYYYQMNEMCSILKKAVE